MGKPPPQTKQVIIGSCLLGKTKILGYIRGTTSFYWQIEDNSVLLCNALVKILSHFHRILSDLDRNQNNNYAKLMHTEHKCCIIYFVS